MKYSTAVSSSRRKCRKAQFSADSESRRSMMACQLSKELRLKHNVRSMPIRSDDEVQVVRGSFKNREGKVITVSRKKWVIHIERITRTKANGSTLQVPIDPSKCVITKLKMDKDRKQALDRKNRGNADAADTMADIDN
jgi:large subunit ribosomal protein L26e